MNMETIFDHNVTSEEIASIGFPDIRGIGSDKEYLSYLKNKGIDASSNKAFCASLDEVSNNLFIALLYHHRGDVAKSKFYADKLPNDMRIDFYRTINHP